MLRTSRVSFAKIQPMSKTVLYLFIGYPGAGKTTIAQIIADKTGAHHIWADVERHKLFKEPTHEQAESQTLYERLNASAEYLLSHGRSVVFDTNFNFLKDRDKLRTIASKHHAKTVIIWVTTPKQVAETRAVEAHSTRNRYSVNMTKDQFDAIASKLETPKDNEDVIKIDGTDLKEEQLLQKLGL